MYISFLLCRGSGRPYGLSQVKTASAFLLILETISLHE